MKNLVFGYEKCSDVIRQGTPGLVTFASDRLEQDKCLHAADVVAIVSVEQPENDATLFFGVICAAMIRRGIVTTSR
jgi:hypothetical protein